MNNHEMRINNRLLDTKIAVPDTLLNILETWQHLSFFEFSDSQIKKSIGFSCLIEFTCDKRNFPRNTRDLGLKADITYYFRDRGNEVGKFIWKP